MTAPEKQKTWWSQPWAVAVWFAAFAAGVLAFINGIPQFVDETLPWLGEHIKLGPLDPTTWDLLSLALTSVSLVATAIVASEMTSRTGRALLHGLKGAQTKLSEQAAERKKHHTLVAVGGTTITCSCGWRGPGWKFKEHQQAP